MQIGLASQVADRHGDRYKNTPLQVTEKVKTQFLCYILLRVAVRDAIAVKHAIMSGLLELGLSRE